MGDKRASIFTLMLTFALLNFGQAMAQNEYYSTEQQRLNRGIVDMSTQFIAEGEWIVGFTGSYSTHVNDNYTFAIMEGIESDGYSYNLSPLIAYTISDNRAIGARLKYQRSRLSIDDAYIKIDGDSSDVEVTVSDYYALQHSYTGAALFRQYLPIGRSKRFAIFADMMLEGGGFESKFEEGQPVRGTFSSGYTMGLNVTPGIVAFATNNIAFEVSIGVLGVNYTHSDQTHNQVYTGYVDKTNMNFNISLLSIGLGVSLYI